MIYSPCEDLISFCRVLSYIIFPIPVLYMCGPVVSPGALKPSVGDRTESSWPLVHTSRFSVILFFSFLLSFFLVLHLFSGVYINNNNNNNIYRS